MTKKSFGKRGAAVLLLGLLTLSAPTAYSQVKNRVALLRAKELLASKKYDSARETLQSILKKDKNSPLAQEAWLLEARAMHLQGKHVDALESLDSFLNTFKKSPYKKRARHLLAESYHSTKKYALAASITKDELQEVASPAYRLKLARLYLDLGDEAYDGKEVPSSTPGQTVTQRDYHRANQFYAKALAIQVPADLETPARMRQAECQRALGQHSAAVQTLTLILERFPKSKHIEKVRFEKGEALFALGQYEDARSEYRILEKDSPSYAAQAMERLGDSYRPIQSGDKESSLLGMTHWKRVLKKHKDYKDTERLHWKLAKAYSHLGRHGDSESSYRAFLRLSKDEAKSGDARFLIAESYYRRGNFEQARQAFGTFLGRHPSHRLFATVQISIARSWIDEGQQWAKKKDLKEAKKAVKLWRQFLKRYPVHKSAPQVQGQIAQFWAERKEWDNAISACQEAVNKYPNSSYGSRAQFGIAQIYERAKKDLNKAIDAYVKVTKNFRGHPEYWRAKEILRVMRDTSLRVETPRSFHTGESAFLSVSTRNIPELTFKAYKIDLREYFRKEHRISKVQDLAVALVTPDKTWTLKTKDFEKYRLLSNKVNMPFQEEGAWVVTVENDGFVATSLIIRTDIVTVVKRSRDHLFVFAKNRKTGLPAEGVNVLASNNSKILEEGKTGRDGVYQIDLKNQYNVKVFAHKKNSYAFAKANQKLSQSFGYKPKGFIYTDRPVYRPGQEVNFKVILRDVASGSYILPRKKDKVIVRVFNAAGQSIYEQEGKTNDFGSLRGKLRVSAEGSQGEYSIQVSMGYHNFRGCFFVEDYKKPEFLVNVSASKDDYLTGESISGTIEARSYYGGPVANADVEYEVYRTNQPFDASIHKNNAWFYKKADTDYVAQDFIVRGQGKTDKQGRLKFNFKTKAIDSDSRYALRAVVRGPDRRWISGSGQFFCTSKGYYAIVSSDKKVVRPKEKFQINLSTVAASHQGLAATGELRILRLSAIGGKSTMSETVLQVLPLNTEANGKKSVEVSLPRPGEYELRFVGKDRRGTEVEGAVRIVASGDAEDLAKQAKVRADKEVYRRGDKARILLNSPKADTWALLTFEGSRVLDYKVLHLKKRSTVIELPMKDLYAPNIFVKIAIPTEDGFYQDEDEILVFKYLNVEIEADKKSYSPEGKAQFKIRTLDQSGQAVAAELSLSVVDEKVYALRSETVGGMKPFFYDQRRKNIVSTRVSSSWRYSGHTRAQVSDIIREKRESERAEELQRHSNNLKNKLAQTRDQLRRMKESAGKDSDGADAYGYKGRPTAKPMAPKKS
ncbi:MAG: tetratricopeptide repeat protein, partial [Planctomycetota bacterium]|nr:tetratricopeptide repeat protein [Planctomycetota bacterium]